MSSRSTLVTEIQQLLTGEQADPRPAQGVFLIPLVAELLLHLLPGRGLDVAFVYGTAVAVVPTLGSVAIGRGLLGSRWTVWVPVLDIVALGFYRWGADTSVGIAVAFPAVWLGLQFGRRGVGIATTTVVACFVLPTLIRLGMTPAAFSRVTQVTLMAVICSAAVAMTAELWRSQVELNRNNTGRLELALADLLEQRRLTRTIVNGVDVGLVALDSEGAYDTMNPRHRDFMDLAFPHGHGGVAGQSGFAFAEDGCTLLGTEDMPTSRAVRGESFRDLLVWVGEDPAERRALAVSSTPYFRVDGSFGGAVLAYHDITELVLASRIKDEFVASVSHELRTPLTSIIGYVDIILEDSGDLPEDVRGYLVTVQRNARRLHRLVDDLLSTALQSVTKVLDLERVSLAELLERCAREAGKSAAEAGLGFDCDTSGAGRDVCIDGDPERLAQVFDNLFSNAVKYTPSGGHVSARLVRDEGHAVIRVQDSGRGIAPSELGEIFTKFFRSTSVLTDAIPGIGLGLAITKSIVDAHGGQITATSELGLGTTFEVRLALADPGPTGIAPRST